MQQLAERLANHALSRELVDRNLGRGIDPSLLLASKSELTRLAAFLRDQPEQVRCGLTGLKVTGSGATKTLSPTLIVQTELDKYSLRFNNAAVTSTPRGLLEETIALTYCSSSPQWVADKLEAPGTEAYISIFPQADFEYVAPCVSKVGPGVDKLEVVLCAHSQLRPKANAVKVVPRTDILVTDSQNQYMAFMRSDGGSDFYLLRTPDAIDPSLKRVVVDSDNFETFRTAVSLASREMRASRSSK